MRLPMKLLLLLLFISAADIGLVGCNSGGGTDVGSGYVVGKLYMEDNTVAVGVSVKMIKNEFSHDISLGKRVSDTIEQHEEVSLVTDNNGYVVINDITLSDGYYLILGGSGILKSYKDSVLFKDGRCDMFYDTLRETGSLTGKVTLRYGQDPSSTGIYIFDVPTPYYLTDTAGSFTLKNLAEGEYAIRFNAKYDQYLSFDTMITIMAGVHDTIPEPIELPFYISVTGFSSTMDTLMRSVTFSWNWIDETKISGYQLSTNEGSRPLDRIILKDTSITLYLKESMEARIRILDLNNDPVGSFTPWLHVDGVEKFDMQMVSPSIDTVHAIGWTYAKGCFYVLWESIYNFRDVSVGVFDTTGSFLKKITLNELSNLQAIASYQDTLYLLEKKNDDTLCVQRVIGDDSLYCDINVTMPNNLGVGSNFEIGSDGLIYTSQYMTTIVLQRDGTVRAIYNGSNSHFALTESGLFTNIDKYPSKVVKFNNNLIPVKEYVYDVYGIITDVAPKLFAANNSGIVCCLLDVSLFIFNEQETFKMRLYIKNGTSMVDVKLTADNILYLLQRNGRIDKINLQGIAAKIN